MSGVTPRDAECLHADGEVLSSSLANLCLVGKLVVLVFQFGLWDNMFKLLEAPSALGILCENGPGATSNVKHVSFAKSAL